MEHNSRAGLSRAVTSTAACLLAVALAGCGGGNDAPGASPTPPPGSAETKLAAACDNCAVDANGVYQGTGTAIWSYNNSSASSVTVPIQIQSVAGKQITYLVSNPTTRNITMPNGSASAAQARLSTNQAKPGASRPPHRWMEEFNRTGWAQHATRLPAQQQTTRALATTVPAPAPAIGQARSFYDRDDSLRPTRLARQEPTADGRRLNFWLQDGEGGTGRMTDEMLDGLVSGYAGHHDKMLDLVGPAWGRHEYGTQLVHPDERNIDIVLLNIDPNGRPFGLLGYFFSRNAFNVQRFPTSNQSISVYIDTETIYLASNGVKLGVSTLIHEVTHMANFYNRAITMGAEYAYDLWLEEMSAMMSEDILTTSEQRTDDRSVEVRLRDYMSSGEAYCSVTGFDTSVGNNLCFGYEQVGSFGGYLLRNLGVDFFKAMINARDTDSMRLVQTAASAYSTLSFNQHLQRFQIAVASGLPATAAPATYGFPARMHARYPLASVDPARYTASLPLSLYQGQVLAPGGSVAISKRIFSNEITDSVQVPPGTSLSVVVAD